MVWAEKVAQRVAGQSLFSSSLNTGINGGSFKDNLTLALLANLGGHLHSEGANLSAKTATYLQDIQKANTDQIVRIFDPKKPDTKLRVFGQLFESVDISNKSGTTKIFATQRLTDHEIRSYALSLTGGIPLQEVRTAPGRFYAVLSDGSTVNLRNVSSSADITKARWTIEIIGNKQIEALQGKVKKKIEIKLQ
ncbi:DUF637 domain-containing protein [Yersinia mollaretii]|uniref:DUF637 domain-containing protein n=1 Tax=Yersinia mollaretii TaxID=33060 RepID=UPI00346026DA